MFINSFCLFYTCVILLCHVGEGPVPAVLVLIIIIMMTKTHYRESHNAKSNWLLAGFRKRKTFQLANIMHDNLIVCLITPYCCIQVLKGKSVCICNFWC